MTLSERIQALRLAKKSIRCSDLADHLTALGFEVRDGSRGGHKVFTHPHLPDFTTGSFNCGHGRNPEIKPAYVAKVIRILEQHQDDLQRLLPSS